ncbi:hypothetical protein BYT27DRAFT_7237721 [Phlegmacium glaucopus]|nr:hypothetical protein BYT27DRAFT_7237721 [Phlegmacium glaucopus]
MSFRHPTFRILSCTHGGPSESILGRISSNRNRRERRSYYVKKSDRELIVTLDPNKFVEKKQQRLSLGNKTIYTAHIDLHDPSTRRATKRLAYDRTSPAGTMWPFPPDTKAFLYYTIPPGKPRIAGELRFRVTLSDDPASFASGSDLLRGNGQPWWRPLCTISKTYVPLYQKLREEGLVPDDLDAILSTFSHRYFIYTLGQVLYTLDDTFTIDLSNDGHYISVITEQGKIMMPFRRHFFDNRASRGGTPYTGTVLARFERSTLAIHKDTRTVVLRFLKFITPVKCVMPLYDGYIGRPKEGELHQRIPFPKKAPIKDTQVWSVNLDEPKRGLVIPGLRLLWDA